MANAHLDGQGRVCGAVTLVAGQGGLRINGRLWAVAGDPNDHGGGGLISSHSNLRINGRAVIVAGDGAMPDSFCPKPPQCGPSATGFISGVRVG